MQICLEKKKFTLPSLQLLSITSGKQTKKKNTNLIFNLLSFFARIFCFTFAFIFFSLMWTKRNTTTGKPAQTSIELLRLSVAFFCCCCCVKKIFILFFSLLFAAIHLKAPAADSRFSYDRAVKQLYRWNYYFF